MHRVGSSASTARKGSVLGDLLIQKSSIKFFPIRIMDCYGITIFYRGLTTDSAIARMELLRYGWASITGIFIGCVLFYYFLAVALKKV